MDRNTDRVCVFVEKCEPVVHVGTFLRRYAFNSLVVYRLVAVARYLHVKSADFEQVAETEQYVQIYSLFRNTVRRSASAVDPAMRRVSLNLVRLFGGLYSLGAAFLSVFHGSTAHDPVKMPVEI